MTNIRFFILAFVLFAGFCTSAFGNSPIVSLDGTWKLRHDPDNIGKAQNWQEFAADKAGNVDVPVPGNTQLVMPDKRGVFWFYRSFDTPVNAHPQGRYILRFWQVDYYAEVWLNGKLLGSHEGMETPFEFDVTHAIQSAGASNRLAIRIIMPTDQPIDGIVLKETTERRPVVAGGADVVQCGLTDDVELLIVPAIRVKDVFVRPNYQTGEIAIRTTLEGPVNPKPFAGKQVAISIDVVPSYGGETLLSHSAAIRFSPENQVIETTLKLEEFRPWDIDDPYMYRVSVRSQTKGESGFSEQSARCGFRDFRFENGAFRLNGRRIYLKCSHSGKHSPIGLNVPLDREMVRKDILFCKTMGFNAIRYISSMPPRLMLEQCDDNGMLVYEESRASFPFAVSEHMERRVTSYICEMILRDRNHPSIVMWGLINEITQPVHLNAALKLLPTIRELDETRLVLYNSGSWEKQVAGWNPLDVYSSYGSVANPGSTVWENTLSDLHPYQPSPHSDAVLRTLRTGWKDVAPMFLSEYGMGSGIDLDRLVRHYEQRGRTDTEDAVYYRKSYDQFMQIWERLKMDDTFADPAEYFRQSIEWMAPLRLLGINAIRANPSVIGYNLTGTLDHGFSGEGLFTWFRELKYGTTDAMADAFAPLRFCLFADQWQVYSGAAIRFEAVLANEDVLKPGEYKVHIQITGPKNHRVFDEVVSLTVPGTADGKEPPYAIPFFDRTIAVDGPSGAYRFHATMLKGGAPAGRPLEFYVTDPKDMPAVHATVALWGDDPELGEWLRTRGIKTKTFEAATASDVILVGRRPGEDFAPLLQRMEKGARVIFLCPEVFQEGEDKVARLPLENKGQFRYDHYCWLYHKDDWTKNHPYFDGLPSGQIMDHAFYRNLLNPLTWSGQDDPEEIAAAAVNTAMGEPWSGLLTAVYRYGKGRFVLNTLRIRDNLVSAVIQNDLYVNQQQIRVRDYLGTDPVAERILRNMINHEARQGK